MKHKKVLILLLLSLLLETRGDGTQEFYPFGQPAGDTRLKYSLDQSAVALKTPLIFLQKPIDEIFLSHNGIIGLGKPVPEKNEILAKIPTPAIAVFYSPVANGKIDYRVTSDDQGLLAKLTQDVKQAFTDAVDFHGLQAVVITWSDIQNAEQDGPASFQIAIVTDGISTYCINHYGALPWSSSMGYYAQTGFVRSLGQIQTNVNSGGPDVKELSSLSNNQFGNSFIFRISGNSIEDPKDDGTDEYDYNNYDQEYEGEQPADCPKDKFVDNCPAECRTVRDERGCERCICAERPNAPPVPQEPRPELENTVDDDDDEEEQVDGTRYQEPTREQEQQPQPQYNQHHQQSAGQTAQKMSCSQRDDKSCHANSVCQDLEGGFCCTCDTGYYGNGKECLPKGEPQRISGSFEGVINRIPIDKTELHTFATSTDGNVHTAVSKIPSDLGHPLLFLYSIGGVMGWLFADVQSPNVYNGFQLTGGLFNRTVAIHVGQNNYVTLKQEFSGRNIHDYFKSHLFVSGTLPDIAPGSEVIFPDYEEEYVRERRGYLTSRAAFDVIIRDGGNTQTYRMSVEQQITFEECPFKEFDRDHSMKLHVKRINVVYNADEGVVRYGAKNFATRSTSPASNSAPSGGHFDRRQHGQSQLASERPIEIPYNNEAISSDSVCAPGRHQCTLPNMKCRVVDPSYRCECEPGYQATHDASSHIGWICQDLDECQRGDHNCDQHAKCTNRPGAFSCQCLPGYQGDGRSCIREQHAGHHEHHQHQQQSQHSGVGATSEGLCTAHNQCHQWGECVFTSEHPTGRCKCRGWYVGDGVNHCGPPEENKPKHNAHIPQNRGQACGSYVCDVNAECMPEPSGGSECVCKAGFSGNGITCESLLEDRHAHSSHNRHEQQQQTGSLGKVCRSHEECSEHGSCAYHHNLGYYQCACTEPYVGNGVDCTLPGSSASADSSSRTDKLLVARGMAIFERSTNPDEYGKQLIVIPHHIPVGIDYDCQTEKIVWSDMSGHSIRTASMNGTDHKSFFSKELSSPEGIAVDWSSRNVYYADSMNDEIGVASLNGKFKKSLVTEGLVNPRSVVLDLYGRHLYYSDWHRENPYIGRVDMDGKNNRVFLNEDIHLPNGLTILPNRRELCWVDAGNHRLSCVQFNGANRRTVFSSLQYPFGLTHDQEQKFYWTDWKDNRIHSVGVYGEGYRSFQISLGGSGKVFGILAVPKSCLGPNTPCSENNGGCEHLCLPGQNGAVCECPDNVKAKGC
ncbi:hypothetical protein L5515_008151 [Caenorhabditis briggsae]|uniref:Protein CBR-NID-1 n=1 Tax=Caenorhabditis briggsae TaxID=6238 RepID=A0AAE9F572_CAEBR|nr:hypothetical protein L5515_008151 [Caenorhabditis briggsae]